MRRGSELISQQHIMFTTERLRLRACKSFDFDLILDLYNDVSVQSTMTYDYVVPRGSKFVESIRANLENCLMGAIIETKDGGDFVGYTLIQTSTANVKNRDGTFGIALLPQFWGRGYGKEVTKFMVDYAFRWLGLHRISLDVFENNRSAIALYLIVGFVEEGRKRKGIWINGSWQDVISMGILEEEWAEKVRLGGQE